MLFGTEQSLLAKKSERICSTSTIKRSITLGKKIKTNILLLKMENWCHYCRAKMSGGLGLLPQVFVHDIISVWLFREPLSCKYLIVKCILGSESLRHGKREMRGVTVTGIKICTFLLLRAEQRDLKITKCQSVQRKTFLLPKV